MYSEAPHSRTEMHFGIGWAKTDTHDQSLKSGQKDLRFWAKIGGLFRFGLHSAHRSDVSGRQFAIRKMQPLNLDTASVCEQ